MELVEVLVPLFGILIPIVFTIALFAYLAFAKRADSRRREEEARARYDFLKRASESGGFDVQKYIDFEQAEQRMQRQRRLESLSLKGMILAAVGVAAIPFFWFITEPKLATIGLFPAIVGAALLLGAKWMARAERSAGGG